MTEDMNENAGVSVDPVLEVNSLDALLAESMEQLSARKGSQALLAKIRQGRATEGEKQQVHFVELKASWQPVAYCEMWNQTDCSCGHSHAVFVNYMVEYKPLHATATLAHRWVKVDGDDALKVLGQKAIYSVTEVFHCSECSGPEEGAEVVVWENGNPATDSIIEG